MPGCLLPAKMRLSQVTAGRRPAVDIAVFGKIHQKCYEAVM